MMSTETPTLASRLRNRRLELGLTQQELAEKAGTSQAVIQKVDNSKSLRPRIIPELASALHTTPEWLEYGVLGEAPKDTQTPDEQREAVIKLAKSYGLQVEEESEAMDGYDHATVTQQIT